MDHRLKRFRKLLREKGATISPLALDALEESAEFSVRYYLGKPKRLGKSEVARELKAMAKGLKRASEAAELLGEQGMVHLFAASLADAEADNFDSGPHVAYLSQMARSAERAAGTAVEHSKLALANKGGRPANQNFLSLIVILWVEFEKLLGIRAEHAISKGEKEGEKEGRGASLFDVFVHEAINEFAPSGFRFKPRLIDDSIQRVMSKRVKSRRKKR